MKNWTLYTHLYICWHRTFNDCCIDAMDFDDNFDASSPKNKKEKRKLTHFDSSSSGDLDLDKIVEIMLKRLGQTYRPPYRPMGYQQAPTPSATKGPCMCGICVKPHKIEQCTSYMFGANQPPTRCW